MQRTNFRVDTSGNELFSSGTSSYDIEVELGRDVLTQICCGLLSRKLDFSGSKLETLLGDMGESETDHGQHHLTKNISSGIKHVKKSIEKGIHSFTYHRQGMSRIKEERAGSVALVFGSTIAKDNSLVILHLIEHMLKYTSLEGIFRKPGNKLRVSQLVEELSKGGFNEILQDSNIRPHDLASILKQYFSELQDSILPSRHLDAYLQVAGLSNATLQLGCLQLLTLLLPVLHRLVLQQLLGLLYAVSSDPSSKMDAHALAVVFAPNLIWPLGELDLLSGDGLVGMVSIVEQMIVNYISLFSVPDSVQQPARSYLKRKRQGELDAAIEIPVMYCQQVKPQEFHVLGKERVIREVAELYGEVQKMAEGSLKQHLLKRFEHNHRIVGTPPSFVVDKSRKNSLTSTPSRVQLDKGIGSDDVEDDLPPRKRLKTQSSIELMNLRIQSSSSDEFTINPETPVRLSGEPVFTTPYKVTPV